MVTAVFLSNVINDRIVPGIARFMRDQIMKAL
jgi:hypothetical protein